MWKSYLGMSVLAFCLRVANTQQLEAFQPGQCHTDPDNDLLLMDVPYWVCIDECRARASCWAINVHSGTGTCRLNMNRLGRPVPCRGFDYSHKDTWALKQLPDCENCGQGTKCAVDPRTRELACLYYECPAPVAISNGRILGNVKPVNTKIEYMCDHGYTLNVPRFRICDQSTGQWSGTEPSCNA